ncbi:MAG: hypothetical protein MZV63_36150, partial [Marinilabiliales bacterium]|nr:hypothetical protein [Marinilabiliales bacterium]
MPFDLKGKIVNIFTPILPDRDIFMGGLIFVPGMQMMITQHNIIFIKSIKAMNPVFEIARKITKNKVFNAFIFILILFSAIIIGVETYSEVASKHRLILVFLDNLII